MAGIEAPQQFDVQAFTRDERLGRTLDQFSELTAGRRGGRGGRRRHEGYCWFVVRRKNRRLGGGAGGCGEYDRAACHWSEPCQKAPRREAEGWEQGRLTN